MPDEQAKQAALERALEDEETLVLLYQPIHDAITREVYSAEALLRQRRENGELREASIIHKAAEESCGPELFQLDHFLVQKAYVEAAHWPSAVRLNVNLSPREFQEGNVLRRLHDLIGSCGMDPHRVNVEITETSYIDKPEETMDVLLSLKRMGIGLWLDDFGTGHSAMTHLQHFPVDGLKLPGAFVKDLPHDKRCAAIVSRLVSLAHDLGMQVIAEEVEREEQLDFLLAQQCEYIQGFLFSKPMLPTDFETLLANGAPASSRPARRPPVGG
jgi:EAL domain-containing protein (putative c-di-GMP-specific phosphodiesterase class I)